MEGKSTWFRCRKCGWTVRQQYHGQWATEFPICQNCGVKKGRVDTLADPVRLRRVAGDTFVPWADSAYGSSRFGPGCEVMTFEQCQHPLGPWRMAQHGPQRALFRCRDCGFEKLATYRGQWKTIFPVCEGTCGANNGRIDCVDWWGESSAEFLPYRSTRYGPGTESYRLELSAYRNVWRWYFATYLLEWNPTTPGIGPL